MDSSKSLSDIARTILVEDPSDDQNTLREKAGVLALLNLLGIMEAFFGEQPVSEETLRTVHNALMLKNTGEQPEPLKAPAMGHETSGSPIDLLGSLAKMMGSPPQAGTADQAGQNREAGTGFDPSLLTSLLSMMSTMAKMRQNGPTPKVKPAGEKDSHRPSEVEDGEPLQETPETRETRETGSNSEDRTASEKNREPVEVSPLQQFLGVDPRVLTLILNFLADVMRNRNAAEKSGAIPGDKKQEDSGTKVTLSKDGREVLTPSGRKPQPPERVYHRPGLGIYRPRGRPSRAMD